MMAEARPIENDELSAPPAPRPQYSARAQPTMRTVRDGDLVWFPYTASQWMRGRVVSFGRCGLRVQVMGGELPRTVYVRWSDAKWHQRRPAY
jgi:hypothetical protein